MSAERTQGIMMPVWYMAKCHLIRQPRPAGPRPSLSSSYEKPGARKVSWGPGVAEVPAWKGCQLWPELSHRVKADRKRESEPEQGIPLNTPAPAYTHFSLGVSEPIVETKSNCGHPRP